MEYLPGGELYYRLEQCGWNLWRDHAVFYVANTVLALEALHRASIAYVAWLTEYPTPVTWHRPIDDCGATDVHSHRMAD